MANDEVLGPRKTMFVLVIVVGCFAVLWPRILSPVIMGNSREQLKPNQFDREAGCCEVIFDTEVAVLELVNEVCNSALGITKLSPHAAADCRKAVNETCGVDIAAFLKRNENVGKSTKMLVDIMKNSNSSCLREHFGVPIYLNTHFSTSSWTLPDTVKQERPSIRMGPHPALRERGRAIPPGTPVPSKPVALPPHLRVRSPLSVYYDLEIKPPPIPGMRPPLGSPGGPVPAPKSSMGFVMPIYTICIIVFFVYTLSKILFKRTGSSPYDPVPPDPQFRRRVFRDDSRTTPDKIGHKETDTIVTAISGLVAEVQQQMEASYVQNQQRQETADNTRPYTNGTILLNSGPVHIVASEYNESKNKTTETKTDKEPSPKPNETILEEKPEQLFSNISEDVEKTIHDSENKIEDNIETTDLDVPENVHESKEDINSEFDKLVNEETKVNDDGNNKNENESLLDGTYVDNTDTVENMIEELLHDEKVESQIKDEIMPEPNLNEEFLIQEKSEMQLQKESTPELLEEALKEDLVDDEVIGEDKDNQSVKVIGMELTAHTEDGGAWPSAEPSQPAATSPPHKLHEAEEVKSIFLETEIPQQSRVLISDFAENRTDSPEPKKNPSLVVSGKITLSLIQDAPRDTPERDPESTVDDFTTASAMTQAAAEKEELSDEEVEEVDEEIEIEEIEEEIEVEEDEEEEDAAVKEN